MRGGSAASRSSARDSRGTRARPARLPGRRSRGGGERARGAGRRQRRRSLAAGPAAHREGTRRRVGRCRLPGRRRAAPRRAPRRRGCRRRHRRARRDRPPPGTAGRDRADAARPVRDRLRRRRVRTRRCRPNRRLHRPHRLLGAGSARDLGPTGERLLGGALAVRPADLLVRSDPVAACRPRGRHLGPVRARRFHPGQGDRRRGDHGRCLGPAPADAGIGDPPAVQCTRSSARSGCARSTTWS